MSKATTVNALRRELGLPPPPPVRRESPHRPRRYPPEHIAAANEAVALFDRAGVSVDRTAPTSRGCAGWPATFMAGDRQIRVVRGQLDQATNGTLELSIRLRPHVGVVVYAGERRWLWLPPYRRRSVTIGLAHDQCRGADRPVVIWRRGEVPAL